MPGPSSPADLFTCNGRRHDVQKGEALMDNNGIYNKGCIPYLLGGFDVIGFVPGFTFVTGAFRHDDLMMIDCISNTRQDSQST